MAPQSVPLSPSAMGPSFPFLLYSFDAFTNHPTQVQNFLFLLVNSEVKENCLLRCIPVWFMLSPDSKNICFMENGGAEAEMCSLLLQKSVIARNNFQASFIIYWFQSITHRVFHFPKVWGLTFFSTPPPSQLLHGSSLPPFPNRIVLSFSRLSLQKCHRTVVPAQNRYGILPWIVVISAVKFCTWYSNQCLI